MSLHINLSRVDDKAVRACVCPDCKKRTRMLGFFQEWYGWAFTCLRCGRRYADGEWLPLPFMRGARPTSIATAKAHWRASPGAAPKQGKT